jgi:5'-3' exonuclease
MGIPYYVASLIRTHKHLQTPCKAPLDVDVLGIDFNCFIHAYLRAENPVGSIVVALNDLLTKTVRAKKVYVAFDGLVPYAKMVQQRYRRMRRADSEGFDKHQISPGTPFMKKLATTLKFIYPELEVSDTSEAGEGEHKIFTWLQRMPETDRKSICIYGLDADLVVIALAQSHLGNIQVLRETETGFASLSIQALERVLPIDKETYIRMSIMCFGNDFMPTLAMFSLREDGYARAVYYANRNDADKDETKLLVKRSSNANRRVIAVDGHALESRFGCHLMDGVVDWEPVCFAFWKTYEWTYHYFTTSEVLDWEWVYPYPEAPLLQTIDFYERPTEFVWEHPTPTMTVEEQLQFILPEHSLHTTGITSTFPDELYNEETETRNLWMKRFAWETDPWVSLPRGTLTTVSEFPLM